MSEIELHGDENESKMRQLKFFFIWKSLKQTAINWNLQLDGVIRPGKAIENFYYQVYGVQQQKERQTFTKTNKKSTKILRDKFVLAQNAFVCF